MKKLLLLLATMLFACSPGEKIETQHREDLNFEGPNLSDFLFDYFTDHYTDTYTIADGKVEIRAEYEFFSSWGCISYYLTVEKAISETIKDANFLELTENPQHFADLAEKYFHDRYDWLKMKIRNLQFTQISKI